MIVCESIVCVQLLAFQVLLCVYISLIVFYVIPFQCAPLQSLVICAPHIPKPYCDSALIMFILSAIIKFLTIFRLAKLSKCMQV